jgi:probable F420-dependent oxidoreductase
MKIGLNFFPLSPKSLFPLAKAADALGYESVWLGEHVVIPARIESAHPFNPELGPPLASTPIYDPLIAIGYMAAQTTRLRFGTAVYLNMLRHPIAAARLVTTADQVSGGRMMLGVGAAWLKEEFDALDAPWAHRGARLDESLTVMRRLWREELVAHSGRFYQFDAVGFEPKPVNGAVPIHIGGEAPSALQRAARIGDGWVGAVHTPESAAQRIGELRALRAAAAPLEITVTSEGVPTLDTVKRFRDAGVDRLSLIGRLLAASPPRTLEAMLDGLTRFAADVIDRLDA